VISPPPPTDAALIVAAIDRLTAAVEKWLERIERGQPPTHDIGMVNVAAEEARP
jgi:hypothetical protein